MARLPGLDGAVPNNDTEWKRPALPDRRTISLLDAVKIVVNNADCDRLKLPDGFDISKLNIKGFETDRNGRPAQPNDPDETYLYCNEGCTEYISMIDYRENELFYSEGFQTEDPNLTLGEYDKRYKRDIFKRCMGFVQVVNGRLLPIVIRKGWLYAASKSENGEPFEIMENIYYDSYDFRGWKITSYSASSELDKTVLRYCDYWKYTVPRFLGRLKPDRERINAYQDTVRTVVENYNLISAHLRVGDRKVYEDERVYRDVSGLDLVELNKQMTVPNDWKDAPKPAENKLVLYRLTNSLFKRADLANLQTDNIPRQGEVFTCEGFVHTTLHSDRFYELYSNESDTEDAGSRKRKRDQHLFIIEIHVDLSNKDIPIPVFAGNVSHWPYQHEVVLPHASMFRVIDTPRLSNYQQQDHDYEINAQKTAAEGYDVTVRRMVITLRLEYLGVSTTFSPISSRSKVAPLFEREFIYGAMAENAGTDDLHPIRTIHDNEEFYYGGDAAPMLAHACTRNRLGLSFCVALLSIAASLVT
jgi:hypothetical protein